MTFPVLLALLARAVAAGGELPLPERIDFRQDPAFIVLSVSPSFNERIGRLEREGCPGFDALEKNGPIAFELWRIRTEIEAKVRAKMPPAMSESDRLLALAKDSAYVRARREEVDANQRTKDLHRKVDPCVAGISRDNVQTMELFDRATPGVTRMKIRFRAGAEAEAQRVGDTEWTEYRGDYVPGGESGYFYSTILEKNGDLIRIAIEGFSDGLWFDYRKTYGSAIGPSAGTRLGIEWLFPRAGERSRSISPSHSHPTSRSLVPERIEGEYGIFRDFPTGVNGDDLENRSRAIEDALKRGNILRKKLSDLFGPDGRLEYVPVSGC